VKKDGTAQEAGDLQPSAMCLDDEFLACDEVIVTSAVGAGWLAVSGVG